VTPLTLPFPPPPTIKIKKKNYLDREGMNFKHSWAPYEKFNFGQFDFKLLKGQNEVSWNL
jgi:hypothetical protein